ncbi:hypothetical protein F5Y10DRAFT_76075 [Nemania abortiva]|nr:hypothetical protein F5Y10DRAFT_76075 [Nemania abortiva]
MCVRRHTIANDATEGFQSLPVLVDRIFDLLMPSWEPPVPKGKKRVRWICQCGTRLFDDFVELQPGMVENLEAELQQHASGSGFEAWKQVGKLLAIAIKTWITSRFMGERLGTSNITSTHLPLHNTNAQTNISSIPLNRGNLHLLLCVEKGDFETKLHQEIIDGYSNDKDMFRFLHKKYHHSYQKFKTWFTIRGISQLSLTRFKVDLGSFAEAHAHASICNPSCVCLPPKNRIGVEYRCDPAPETDPGYVPAIGSARLTHYFRNPECVNDRQTTIYTQLPKRIVGELLASETKEELGWGIHFQAGWHWRTIYVILVVFLFCFSLIFGIVWSISKTDIQGAFAISGFWLTSGGILLGYLAIRSP